MKFKKYIIPIIIVILGFIFLIAFDFSTFLNNRFIAYQIVCGGKPVEQNGKCLKFKQTYIVNKDTVWDEYISLRYEKCSVDNKNNWECKRNDVNDATFGVVNGKFYEYYDEDSSTYYGNRGDELVFFTTKFNYYLNPLWSFIEKNFSNKDSVLKMFLGKENRSWNLNYKN